MKDDSTTPAPRVLDFRDVRGGDPMPPGANWTTIAGRVALVRFLCPSVTEDEAFHVQKLAISRQVDRVPGRLRALCHEVTGTTESRTLPREDGITRVPRFDLTAEEWAAVRTHEEQRRTDADLPATHGGDRGPAQPGDAFGFRPMPDPSPPAGIEACPCGRAFCGGAALAGSIDATAQALVPETVDLARRLAAIYTWAATAYAAHGRRDEALPVGAGWIAVAAEALTVTMGGALAHAIRDRGKRRCRCGHSPCECE